MAPDRRVGAVEGKAAGVLSVGRERKLDARKERQEKARARLGSCEGHLAHVGPLVRGQDRAGEGADSQQPESLSLFALQLWRIDITAMTIVLYLMLILIEMLGKGTLFKPRSGASHTRLFVSLGRKVLGRKGTLKLRKMSERHVCTS